MSTILHPVGSQPRRVYWMRRLVVLGALVVAIVLVYSLVAGGSSGDAAKPAAGASPRPSASAKTAPTGDCAKGDVTIALAIDRTSFAKDENPNFTVTITNTSSTQCTVDAGEASRALVVTSGKDRVWSSTDCSAGKADSKLLLLDTGKAHTSAATWPRVRSDETCTKDLPTPKPGTYKAQASLLGATSDQLSFTLK